MDPETTMINLLGENRVTFNGNWFANEFILEN